MDNAINTKHGSLQQRLFIGEGRALHMRLETDGNDDDMATARAIVLLGMLANLARKKYTSGGAAGRMAKALEAQQQVPWTNTEKHLRIILAGFVEATWHKRDGFDEAINKLTTITWVDNLLQPNEGDLLESAMDKSDKPAFARLSSWSACKAWQEAMTQTMPKAVCALHTLTQPLQERVGLDFWTLYRDLLKRLGYFACLGGGDGCLSLWRQAKNAACDLSLTEHEREDAAGMAVALTRALSIGASLDVCTRGRLAKLAGDDWAGMLVLVGAGYNMVGGRDVIKALDQAVSAMSKKTVAQAARELSTQDCWHGRWRCAVQTKADGCGKEYSQCGR